LVSIIVHILLTDSPGAPCREARTHQPFPHEAVPDFEPPRICLMRTAAHPTPASTRMAPAAQFRWQAPHSMHRSRRAMRDRWDEMAYTAWGHTWTHNPQPLQRASSSTSEWPLRK
jgi:hypothetical protein